MGKSIYFTDEQLDYLIVAMDPINAQEDEERDKIREQIYDKVSN